MAVSEVHILSVGVLLTAAATQFRGVQVTGAAVTAGGPGYVAQTAGAIGERVTLTVLGTQQAEAGAAIAAGALLEFDAAGRVITRTTGTIIGRLAPGYTAAAAGDQVEIIPMPN